MIRSINQSTPVTIQDFVATKYPHHYACPSVHAPKQRKKRSAQEFRGNLYHTIQSINQLFAIDAAI